MEAISYVLVYFLKEGKLPWQGLKVKAREDKYKKIYEKKKSISAEELCAGFPRQFTDFVSYTRGLEFTESPDYDYLINLMEDCMKKNDIIQDFSFCWIKPTENVFDKKSQNEDTKPTDAQYTQFKTLENNNQSNIIRDFYKDELGDKNQDI